MVTGDSKTNAIAFARECHILNGNHEAENDSIMEGPEFN
jgi:magnesium-transporting ATPase (P-type)